jgi:pimeloyl-ACP methyl ester carboxylesterase
MQMPGSILDNWLTRWSAWTSSRPAIGELPTHSIDTSAGSIRVFDSGSQKPCVVFVPDGPNVIEHYAGLMRALSPSVRVVCFDMPGFGHSLPRNSYGHTLDQGANAVLAVLDRLGIRTATLAFSCANGFYALRAARIAPDRIASLFLSQTPSLYAMHAWVARVIPWPLKISVVGQVAAWFFRQKVAHDWYEIALPKARDRAWFREPARQSLSSGGCFCLAGVVQGLLKERPESLTGVTVPCTMIWGGQDKSHRHTHAESLLECVPQAHIVRFDDSGHFPDLEQPERYMALLLEHVASLDSDPLVQSAGDDIVKPVLPTRN